MKRLITILLFLAAITVYADEILPQRQSELLHLLKHDCGACHGMTLKGGLGPSLLPEALIDKPIAFLQYTILEGRPGTPMPPWRDFLTLDEANWLVTKLIEGIEEAPNELPNK